MSFRLFGFVGASALMLTALMGCASESAADDGLAADEDTVDDSEYQDALKTCSGALYYGSCKFLHDASKYSRKLPEGRILPYCSESSEGVDCEAIEEGVVAVPRNQFTGRALCGRYVRIVYEGKTVYAKIIEKSNTTSSWELSSKVFDQFGAPYKSGSYNYSTKRITYGSGCLMGAKMTIMAKGFVPPVEEK